MNKYLIRFNTKNAGSNLKWRIFENGKEKLAENLKINVPCWGESSYEEGVEKWNICCVDEAVWDNFIVTIQ